MSKRLIKVVVKHSAYAFINILGKAKPPDKSEIILRRKSKPLCKASLPRPISSAARR